MQRKADARRAVPAGAVRPAWQAYYDARAATVGAARRLEAERRLCRPCAEAVYRLHRLEGPQTATRLQELAAAWEAWDVATLRVIGAEEALAAAVAAEALAPRPVCPEVDGWRSSC